MFNSAAVAVTNTPPNFRPFVPSWEATSISFVPSETVKPETVAEANVTSLVVATA